MEVHEEVIPLPPRAHVATASHFRGTWLAGSIRALRARGLHEAYFAALPLESADAIRASIAGEWLPVSVAVDHYRAIDGLGLSYADQVAIGREVALHAQGAAVDVAAKLARGLGATPWTVFGQLDRIWRRTWIGGAVAVLRAGPKDARVRIVRWPCASVAYCRSAMCGVLTGLAEPVAHRVFVSPIARESDDQVLGYRVAWA
jgi:hypothetical protein